MLKCFWPLTQPETDRTLQTSKKESMTSVEDSYVSAAKHFCSFFILLGAHRPLARSPGHGRLKVWTYLESYPGLTFATAHLFGFVPFSWSPAKPKIAKQIDSLIIEPRFGKVRAGGWRACAGLTQTS